MMNGFKRSLMGITAAFIFPLTAYAEAVKADAGFAPYRKTLGIKGNLNSVGSDTCNNLMTYWAEGFRKMYSGANVQVEGKGSSTAPPALTAGAAQLGPMSREMKAQEMDAFEAKHGFKPTRFRIAVDGLAVFVHKDNPVKSFSLSQLDAIFGKSRKRGAPADIATWGQLGLKGDFATRPIVMFGRNAASGTYGYFKEHALDKGDFKDTVKEQPGSASVVQGITEDRFAVGYSGVGYRTSGVRTVPLSEKDGGPVFEDTAENIYSGKYPLSRYLNLYVVKDPKKGIDPLVKEFIRYIYSKEGQDAVVKDGFLPVPREIAAKELEQLK